MTTLLEIVRNLDTFDPSGMIYAATPWTEKSQAIVVTDTDGRTMRLTVEGVALEYLLAVFIAVEVLEDWQMPADPEFAAEAKCARLIQYAIYDA
ncbi:MAG: hypothetical protein WC655_13340 [Candidatus Hydrogenedentales bacterium]|jgi:hypothetical protein